MVGRWPALKELRRGEDVLHAMDHRGLVGHFLDAHKTFHAQQARAAVLGQRLEQQSQRERGDGAITLQDAGCNPSVCWARLNGLCPGWSGNVANRVAAVVPVNR